MVPDMLGYGGTDKPADSSEYSTRGLCADIAALLDLLAIHKAVSNDCHFETSSELIVSFPGTYRTRLGLLCWRSLCFVASR